MRFRPCIDIHNGKVKQIVGGTLSDRGDQAEENFVASQDASFYADLYKKQGLMGGHIILLNSVSSSYYEATKAQARLALETYPAGLQVGGGITDQNGAEFLAYGASHVIVTSFVFQNGELNIKNLDKVVKAVGKEHLVLDLSCRKKDGDYYLVTDRWQKFTDIKVDAVRLEELSSYCDEFLIHGVDVEGKGAGPDHTLVELLGQYDGIPVTYAGGIVSMQDVDLIEQAGRGRLDITIGSALDLFGGNLKYEEILKRLNK